MFDFGRNLLGLDMGSGLGAEVLFGGRVDFEVKTIDLVDRGYLGNEKTDCFGNKQPQLYCERARLQFSVVDR